MKQLDYKKILEIIAQAARKSETVKIYYPKTENNPQGWREVEPYSLTTDIGEEGEHLVFGQDRLSPGHIFNGYTKAKKSKYCNSFIIGKIKKAKLTNKKFKPKWPIEF